MTAETEIAAPKSPLTIQINLAALRLYFDWFWKRYLPAFTARITSEYRDAAHNAEIGGAPNSAHVHGLARDFQLINAAGQNLPVEQARAVYDSFIVPNWKGYTEFEEKAGSYHIHVNISREVGVYTGIAGVAAIGVLGFKLFSRLGEK